MWHFIYWLEIKKLTVLVVAYFSLVLFLFYTHVDYIGSSFFRVYKPNNNKKSRIVVVRVKSVILRTCLHAVRPAQVAYFRLHSWNLIAGSRTKPSKRCMWCACRPLALGFINFWCSSCVNTRFHMWCSKSSNIYPSFSFMFFFF